MFNRASGLLAAASSIVTGALAGLERIRPLQPHHYGQTRYIGGYKGHRSIYDPHQGEREIARRLRQAARNEERQRARASSDFFAGVVDCGRVSRRGRLIREKGAA